MKKEVYGFGAAVIILSLIAFGYFSTAKLYFSESYAHYRVGERLYKEKKFEAALKEFELAFKLDPYNRAARQRMVELKEALGILDYEKNRAREKNR